MREGDDILSVRLAMCNLSGLPNTSASRATLKHAGEPKVRVSYLFKGNKLFMGSYHAEIKFRCSRETDILKTFCDPHPSMTSHSGL